MHGDGTPSLSELDRAFARLRWRRAFRRFANLASAVVLGVMVAVGMAGGPAPGGIPAVAVLSSLYALTMPRRLELAPMRRACWAFSGLAFALLFIAPEGEAGSRVIGAAVVLVALSAELRTYYRRKNMKRPPDTQESEPVRVHEDGSLALPKFVMHKLGLRPGDEVEWESRANGDVVMCRKKKST